jgi:ABC-type transporter Mla MlaB component
VGKSPDSLATTLADEGGGRFAIRGALSFDSVPALWRRSEDLFRGAAGARDVDLAVAEPVDSAGLALLVAWKGRASAVGVALTFSNAPARLVALARISEVDSILGL